MYFSFEQNDQILRIIRKEYKPGGAGSQLAQALVLINS